MQKYYYTLTEGGWIRALYKQKTAPGNSVQITRTQYDRYKSILAGIPERTGYDKIVKLYPDFTYTVDYVPIEVTEIE